MVHSEILPTFTSKVINTFTLQILIRYVGKRQHRIDNLYSGAFFSTE